MKESVEKIRALRDEVQAEIDECDVAGGEWLDDDGSYRDWEAEANGREAEARRDTLNQVLAILGAVEGEAMTADTIELEPRAPCLVCGVPTDERGECHETDCPAAELPAGHARCDTCGDTAETEPGLPCGRDLSEERGEPAGTTICEGTYKD
jgi:hypothetical protein